MIAAIFNPFYLASMSLLPSGRTVKEIIVLKPWPCTIFKASFSVIDAGSLIIIINPEGGNLTLPKLFIHYQIQKV